MASTHHIVDANVAIATNPLIARGYWEGEEIQDASTAKILGSRRFFGSALRYNGDWLGQIIMTTSFCSFKSYHESKGVVSLLEFIDTIMIQTGCLPIAYVNEAQE